MKGAICFALCAVALGTAFGNEAAKAPAVRQSDTKIIIWVPQTEVGTFRYESVTPALRSQVKAIVLPVFTGGRTVVKVPGPSAAKPAKEMLDLAGIIKSASADGIKVYGYVNTLDWRSSSDQGGFDLDWYEQSAGHAFAPLSSYGYGTVHNPLVRQHVLGQVTQIAETYPGLGGLIVGLQMPMNTLYAHSLAARNASIKALGIDPVDIDLPHSVAGEGPEEGTAPEVLEKFLQWRSATYSSFLKEVATAARAGNPERRVGLVVDAGLYNYDLGRQINMAQDWFNAAPAAGISDLYFASVAADAFPRLWPELTRAASLSSKPFRFAAVLGDGKRAVGDEEVRSVMAGSSSKYPLEVIRFFTAGTVK